MDASTFAMQGQQAMQAGMYDQAAQAFYQAIQFAPNVDGLYYQYASACLWRGLPNDALGALDRCMALQGPWYGHAAQMATQVRTQMGYPPPQQQMMPGMQMPQMFGGGMMPMGQQPMGGQQMPMQQMPMQQQPMQQQPMQQMPMQPMMMPGQAPMPQMGMQPMQQMPMQQTQPGYAQQAPQAAPAPHEEKKKKGVGWGLAAMSVIGAVALGGAIGTGALDGVANKVLG